ncbi:MAG: DUF1573 domain-containing protein [Phycisphaeraceae bacterium]|nr:DUF1573 domain-containing protein [Phycisphaeraceae bacterium]
MKNQTIWLMVVALSTGVVANLAMAQARTNTDPNKKSITSSGGKETGGSNTLFNAKEGAAARQQPAMSPEELEKRKAMEEGGKEVQAADPANPARPQALQLSATSHDWGSISDDSIVNHTFFARNTTERTVKIAVAASCGCTVSKLDKDTIEPGEEVPITASFNPQGRSGTQTKTLTITVTEPQGEYAQQMISITSNVRPMMAVEPNRTFLQEVDHRQGRQERITVIGRKPGFALAGVDSNSEFVKATIGETTTSEENGETIIRVEVLLDVGRGAPIGTMNSQLTIRSNDSSGKPLTTFVGAEIIGDVRANPASTMIRATAPGSLISADIRVDTRSGKPFQVTAIDIDTRHDMRLAVDLRPASDDSTAYTVSISGIAPATAGLVQGTLLVTTDSEGGETIRIPFTATVPRQAQPQPAKLGSAAPAAGQSVPTTVSKEAVGKAIPVSLTPTPAPTPTSKR